MGYRPIDTERRIEPISTDNKRKKTVVGDNCFFIPKVAPNRQVYEKNTERPSLQAPLGVKTSIKRFLLTVEGGAVSSTTP